MCRQAVTIGILNYNGGPLVSECVRSALSQDYDPFTVLVVDNGSTDNSTELLRKQFPQVRQIHFRHNLGPAAARNWVIRNASTPLVFCLDNDVVLARDCLVRLAEAMVWGDSVAVCGPKVMDYDRRHEVQLGVTFIHYTGAVVVRRLDLCQPVEAGSVGGGAILIDRQTAMNTGLYDEDYFFGLEDNDFCTQQRIAGYRCLHVPDALVYHRAKERGLWAAGYQVRNRWYFLLKFYRLRTLAVVAPALLVHELSTLVFLASRGRLQDYFRALDDLLRHLRAVLEKRRCIQAGRTVPDRHLLVAGEVYMRPEMTVRRSIRLARRLQSRFYELYWKMAGRLI